jgi:CheY-like chemotaxis protein
MRALLVDDSRVDRQLICKLVKSSDLPVEITEAPDAIAALDALATERFDCLLVDQRMPGVIGTEFIRAFRDMEIGSRTPILVLSGENSNALTIEQAVDAGGDFFMAKQDLTAGRLKAALRCLGPGR